MICSDNDSIYRVSLNLISPQFICRRNKHLFFYVIIKMYILKEIMRDRPELVFFLLPQACGIDVFFPLCCAGVFRLNQQKPRETVM